MGNRNVLLGAVTAGLLASAPLRADFARGDVNADARVTVIDAVAALAFLFGDVPSLPCADAADANDDGVLDVSDALALLEGVFARRSLPPPHVGAPGPDPSCDALRCLADPDPTPAVVLSEIHYHHSFTSEREYVELHNRSAAPIDAGGYRFTEGITYTIPAETVIEPGSFLLVTKNPDASEWRRLTVPVVGPYEGELADGGERLSLADGDCELETVRYDDAWPWPRGADGYGASLERIDYREPADDFHAWRAATSTRRSPGAENTAAGTPARPVLLAARVEPAAPRASDAVRIDVTLDLPAAELRAVALRWETVAAETSAAAETAMELALEQGGLSVYRATVPPQPSEQLVRFALRGELVDGRTFDLPHPGEPRPALSYFVYDGEVNARLPVLWLFPARSSDVGGKSLSGAVIREEGAEDVLVFDGADLRPSGNGLKLRFLRGEEFRGDRTLNIIPEEGGGGTGNMAPQMEHLGFDVFRALGGLAPRVDWFRVIEPAAAGRHTQRLVIQQVNEAFFRMNGLDDAGEIFKLDKNQFRKQNHPETGLTLIQDLMRVLHAGPLAGRREALLARVDLESVRRYSVLSVLIENWDGFHNNLFAYHEGTPDGRWKVVPWDLDQVFEPCCASFPLTYPLDGVYPGNGRTRASDFRAFSQPYHQQADFDRLYREELRAAVQPGGPFTVESIGPRIDAIEERLLEDLALLEETTAQLRPARRAQITASYAAMRQYLDGRVAFLRAALE